MSKQENDGQRWIFILLGIVLLLFLSRFLFRLVWLLLLIGVAIGLYFGVMALVKRYHSKKFLKTTEGQIVQRIKYCQNQIEKNRAEMQEIKGSIADLDKKLALEKDLGTQNRDETTRLLEAFRSELKLRATKQSFFETSVKKLEQILKNYGYSKELDVQKEKLRKLQENHYEDLAQLEELKSDVEMDILYLDTIERLSQRIIESTNHTDAEQVRLELETMTRDLKDFDREL